MNLFIISIITFAVVTQATPGSEVSPSDYPFIVLIVAGEDSAILHSCTGSIISMEPNRPTLVLTTAYCIQDRTYPEDPSKQLVYRVLVPDAEGQVEVEGTKYTSHDVNQRIIHSQAGLMEMYRIEVKHPNGTIISIDAEFDVNDIGIIELESPITLPGAKAAVLSTFMELPAGGTPVRLLGFGEPNRNTLKSTMNTISLPSFKLVNNVTSENQKMLFIGESRMNLASNEVEGASMGDEGGPILNQQKEILGLAQGSYRIQYEDESYNLFTVGPFVPQYRPWIDSIIKEIQTPVQAGATPTQICLSFLIMFFIIHYL